MPFATAAVVTSDGTAEEERRSRALALARVAERATHSPSGVGDDDDDVPQMSLTLTNDALHKVGNGWAMLCFSPALLGNLVANFMKCYRFPFTKGDEKRKPLPN